MCIPVHMVAALVTTAPEKANCGKVFTCGCQVCTLAAKRTGVFAGATETANILATVVLRKRGTNYKEEEEDEGLHPSEKHTGANSLCGCTAIRRSAKAIRPCKNASQPPNLLRGPWLAGWLAGWLDGWLAGCNLMLPFSKRKMMNEESVHE